MRSCFDASQTAVQLLTHTERDTLTEGLWQGKQQLPAQTSSSQSALLLPLLLLLPTHLLVLLRFYFAWQQPAFGPAGLLTSAAVAVVVAVAIAASLSSLSLTPLLHALLRLGGS